MLARIHKLDPTAPTFVDDLLAFHATHFGGARMEGDDTGDGDGGSDDGDKGDDDTGDGDDGKDDDAAARAAAVKAERDGRKAVEAALAKATGKSVTQVRKAFKDAGGDATKALAALQPSTDDKGGKDGDDKVDADKIRQEAEQAAREATDAKLVRAGVLALAAETFVNPRDALVNVDLDDYAVDDDGELTDPKAVQADLAKVIKDHPHYAKTPGRPAADRSQGRGGGPKADVQPGLGRLQHAYAESETTGKRRAATSAT